MSRLVLLLVHSRKINLSFLLVKRTLKPRPSGEVAAIADGEGDCVRLQANIIYSCLVQPVGINCYRPLILQGLSSSDDRTIINPNNRKNLKEKIK